VQSTVMDIANLTGEKGRPELTDNDSADLFDSIWTDDDLNSISNAWFTQPITNLDFLAFGG